MGRPSNTDTRRAELVDALLAVMAKRGYEAATIAAIAAEAGLAPGLVHYHFESKHAILVALVERLASGLEARVQGRLAGAGDEPRGKLHAVVQAHVALGPDADPRAVAAWVVVAAEAVRHEDVRAIYSRAVRATHSRLRGLVVECLEGEGREAAGAEQVAAAVLSAIEGAFMLSAAAPGVLAKGYAAPSLAAMLDGLLDAQPRLTGVAGRRRSGR
jgi:TetR/AcrR family transcriptional repressor of bet genes